MSAGRRRAAAAAAAAITALAGGLAATTASAAGWSTPTVLSDHSTCEDVVVDAAGTATAVWVKVLGPGEATLVQSATRRAGRFWGEPRTIAETPTPEGAVRPDGVETCQAVVDGDGVVTAVWNAYTDDDGPPVGAGVYAVQGHGSTWGSPTLIGPGGRLATPYNQAGLGSADRVGVDALGRVSVLYGDAAGVKVVRTAADGGGWEARIPLADDAFPLAFGGNLAGEAVAVWASLDRGTVTYGSAARNDEGGWTPTGSPIASGAASAGSVSADVGPLGGATVLWDRFQAPRPGTTDLNRAVEAADLPAGGTWTPRAFAVPINGMVPRLSYDEGGTATVVFARGTRFGATYDIDGSVYTTDFAVDRAPDGTWGTPFEFAGGPGVFATVDPGGNAAVAGDGYVARRPAGGSWGVIGSPFGGLGGTASVDVASGPGGAVAVLGTARDADQSLVASVVDGATLVPDVRAPVIRSAQFAPYVFTTAEANANGATLAVHVSEAAGIRLDYQHYRGGEDPGFDPVPDPDQRPVVARTKQATLTIPGPAGGFVPGLYLITATATDAAGNVSRPVVTFVYLPA